MEEQVSALVQLMANCQDSQYLLWKADVCGMVHEGHALVSLEKHTLSPLPSPQEKE